MVQVGVFAEFAVGVMSFIKESENKLILQAATICIGGVLG